jgi:hypothetical protein
MKIKPWCSHHLTALQCEPEDTDCLRLIENGWYQVDLGAWWCPQNQQNQKTGAEDEAGEEFGECRWAWTVLSLSL